MTAASTKNLVQHPSSCISITHTTPIMEKFLLKIYNLIQTFQDFNTATPFKVIFMISRSVNHQEGHQSPKFYNTLLSFVGLTTLKTLISCFNKLSVQKIQQLIVIYRRDNPYTKVTGCLCVCVTVPKDLANR